MSAHATGRESGAQPAAPWLRDIRAVAFDLDGTLVDTLPDLHASALRMLAQLGRPAVSVTTVRAYIGDGVDRLVKRLLTGTAAGEPDAAMLEHAAKSFRSHYATVLTRVSHPFPGVVDTLEALRSRGVKLACVTNKPVCFTDPLLQGLGLTKYLDLVIGGDSLPRKKPDALPLLHVASSFGFDPAQLLMVGDSPVDVGAARAAGCPVICVPYGYRGTLTVQELNCDAIVPTLLDLLDLIQIPR